MAIIQLEKGGVWVAIVQKSSTLTHICTRLVIPDGKCDLKPRRPSINTFCLCHHFAARSSCLVNHSAQRRATEVPFGFYVNVFADYAMTRWWRWDSISLDTFPHSTNSLGYHRSWSMELQCSLLNWADSARAKENNKYLFVSREAKWTRSTSHFWMYFIHKVRLIRIWGIHSSFRQPRGFSWFLSVHFFPIFFYTSKVTAGYTISISHFDSSFHSFFQEFEIIGVSIPFR